jgi:excisionase family DNA binding protein
MSAKPAQRTRMFTVNEIADELQLSTKSIRRLIQSGDLQAHQFGDAIRVSPEDLESYRHRRRGYRKSTKV